MWPHGSVNAVMTATYWEIGRRVVEYEQDGKARAGYGEALLRRLSADLTRRFGRGFSERNLEQMRAFHEGWPISQTLSAESRNSSAGRGTADISQTASAESGRTRSATPSRISGAAGLGARFPLPWSHYVRLLAVRNSLAREFYEAEALRGGWTVRQLDRQIGSQFYERTALSRNKAAMLRKGEHRHPGDAITPEEEIKDPLVLEFLDLKDEYSETELEVALIARLEQFLLELGGMTNKILAAEYRTALPDEKLLAEELRRSRKRLEGRPARRADGGAGADRVRPPADGAYEMKAEKKGR